jgi:hypothetical protein
MTANDVILIQDKLARHRKQSGPTLSESEHDTFFTAEQFLKHYSLSHEEILAGMVDGEKDCGIDAIYFFANGICIHDDTPLDKLGRGVRLDVFLLQVKNTSGFKEDAIDKLIVNLPRLLKFDRDEVQLAKFVNSRLIEITRRFLNAFRNLDMPELRIFTCFASLKAVDVHPQTRLKSDELENVLGKLFGGATIETHFLDATTLCILARELPNTTRTLVLAENPISTDTAGGYIGVVRLDEYEQFITASTGELGSSLFEANVRDYEGDTTVNKSIQHTLSNVDPQVDFWWLNNGVTIVSTRVQPAGKLLKLDSPQIVNGLQTSFEIFKRARPADGDARSLLVKVVEARDPAVRDRIIRATNSQTAFGPSALRATDAVQREIEEYLGSRDLFYERRRRYYFNQSVPLEKIVTIDQMGQAVLSVVVQSPHVARHNIQRIYEDDIYKLVFNTDFPVAMYAASIELFRQCESWLYSLKYRSSVDDFAFHLACLSGMALSRKVRPSSSDIAKLEGTELSSSLAQTLFEFIQTVYDQFSRRHGVMLLDQLAKDPEVTKAILARGRNYLMHSNPRDTD